MSDFLSVRIDGQKHLNKQLSALARRYPLDAVRALNKTAQRSATRVRRELSGEVGLPQKELKKRVQYFRANLRNKAASVWVGTKSGVPLSKVGGARVDLRTMTLRAGRTKTTVFPATMPSGHSGLFVRKPGAKHTRPWAEGGYALPIEEPKIRLAKPGRPIILRVSREQMATFFPGELKRLVKRSTDRAARKRSRR